MMHFLKKKINYNQINMEKSVSNFVLILVHMENFGCLKSQHFYHLQRDCDMFQHLAISLKKNQLITTMLGKST